MTAQTRRMPLLLGIIFFFALSISVLLSTESGSRVILQPLSTNGNNILTTHHVFRTLNTTIRSATESELMSEDDVSNHSEDPKFVNASFVEDNDKKDEKDDVEELAGAEFGKTTLSSNGIKETEAQSMSKEEGEISPTLESTGLKVLQNNVTVKPDETLPRQFPTYVVDSQSLSEPSCSNSNSVVFIKTHKTGSTSLGHIINRFGLARNLSFVFNKRSSVNGHLVYLPITSESPKNDFLPPIGVKQGDFAKYKYDLIAVHIRYNRQAMDTFMKHDTKYITIIRDPGHQFESAFTHFQMDDAFLPTDKRRFVTMASRIGNFLSKPDYYRNRLRELSWEGKKGLRWFYSKNNQVFDLGLDHSFHSDVVKVKQYIEELDKGMDLVLITEHFDESMVLLKHTMCWNMDDIIYIAKNVRPNPASISETLRQKMREWNSVDTQLYTHFNQTLWRKIEALGSVFELDLAKFRSRMSEVFDKCVGGEQVKAQGHYFHWVEYGLKKDSGTFCKLLVESKRALFSAIWSKQVPPKPKQTKPVNIRRVPAPPLRPVQKKSTKTRSKETLNEFLAKPKDLLVDTKQASFEAKKPVSINTGAGPVNTDGGTSLVNDIAVEKLPNLTNSGANKPLQIKSVVSSQKS